MIYKLEIPAVQVTQIRQYAQMARQFKPELVESAVLKVVEGDGLSDEQASAGIGMVLYADEATYLMVQQFGLRASEEVDEFPTEAVDFFE